MSSSPLAIMSATIGVSIEDTIVVTEERLSRAHEVGQAVSELRNACPVHHDVECRPRWTCA
jgi:hypothetical protein